jgi:hypothetical protein
LQNVATVRTVTPAIPPVIANPDAGILAAPEVPMSITYTNEIKILEVYSDKLLEIAQKHASLTWGFETFTTQNPRVIHDLTQANGELTVTGRITAEGKKVIQERLQAKIFAYQLLSMLSDDARKVIERQSKEYTWTDTNGLNKEMDGMTILALILRRLRPHYKVDHVFRNWCSQANDHCAV